METQRVAPSALAPRGCRAAVCLVSAGLVLAGASAAAADDMIMGSFTGALAFFGLAAAAAVGTAAGFSLIAFVLEGYVMSFRLKLGFRRCFWLAVAANLVSMGLVWYFTTGQMKWKTALAHGELHRVGPLFARSLVVTVAEETAVVLLMVRAQSGLGSVLKAVPAANGASYALMAGVGQTMGG